MSTATHSPATITIQTDTGPLSLRVGSSLSDALDHLLPRLNRQPEQVATAVNGEFVPRTARATHLLHDGDAVLCFAPITGG